MNYALTVGVNKYQTPGNDLRGCLHDVASMRVLLGNCGFSVMHVRSLIDEQATKKRIIDSLTQMVTNMKEGDHGVFHFSGHGSQVPDSEGDESDGLDEVLCPHDFDWSGTYVKDDELREVLSPLDRRATLDVILDCCHSGTGLREIGDPVAKCIPYLGPIPKVPIFTRMLQDHDLPNVALWAGCRSDQTSADALINGQMQGAMTWAFCRTMQDWNYESIREDLIEGIHLKLSGKFDQEPPLECCDAMAERKVFK